MNNKKMTWTPEEFRFKLFNKKVCPLCSGKLKHHIKKVYVGKERGPNSTLLRDTDQNFFEKIAPQVSTFAKVLWIVFFFLQHNGRQP